jgi:hypothetical protein
MGREGSSVVSWLSTLRPTGDASLRGPTEGFSRALSGEILRSLHVANRGGSAIASLVMSLTQIAPILGISAALVGIAGNVPYIRDTLRRSTRPHRGTWLIWCVLAIVVCLSQRADGASWSLLMAGTHVVLNAAILALAVRLGTGGLSAADRAMITLGGAGVAGWLIVDEPLVATACVVAADLIAAAMMVPKTHRDPGSETLSTFALASLGGALAAGSVATVEPGLLLYPVYYCLVNGALAVLIVHRRAALSGVRPALATH